MTDHGRTLALFHPRMKFIRVFLFFFWNCRGKASTGMWWDPSGMLVLRKWRQENEEFKVAMSYTPSLRPT